MKISNYVSNLLGFNFAIVLIILFSFLNNSCQRKLDEPKDGDNGKIVIKAPYFSKAGALAAIPSNRKACYGVMVNGEDIDSLNAAACSPRLGIFAGYVGEGETISVDGVPYGTNRKVRLFLHLSRTNTCPAFVFNPSVNYDTFIVATAENVEIAGDTNIAMTVNFPGETQNIASQLGMAGTCAVAPTPDATKKPFRISMSQQRSTSTSFKLLGAVGGTLDTNILTSTNFLLKVK